jgi:hypothetical protein
MSDDLQSSQVYKCLEKKNLILGFEIADLLILGILLCVLNLLFANASLKFFLTFVPVGLSAAFLKFMKNGKADNYLKHLVNYHISPGVLRAWPRSTQVNWLYQLQRKKKAHVKFRFK